jgi:hypothetical protein
LKIIQLEIIKKVQKYSDHPRDSYHRVLYELRSKHKCQRDTCDDLDCKNYCKMMGLRFGVDSFPCPHTVHRFHIDLLDLPLIICPTDQEIFRRYTKPVCRDMVQRAPAEPVNDPANDPVHDQMSQLRPSKKGPRPVWDDEKGPKDHGDMLNQARTDRSPV